MRTPYGFAVLHYLPEAPMVFLCSDFVRLKVGFKVWAVGVDRTMVFTFEDEIIIADTFLGTSPPVPHNFVIIGLLHVMETRE